MQTHNLRIYTKYLEKIFNGEKRCEIRKWTRNFQVGDILNLNEINGKKTAKVLVTHIADSGKNGIPKNLCIMSIQPLSFTK